MAHEIPSEFCYSPDFIYDNISAAEKLPQCTTRTTAMTTADTALLYADWIRSYDVPPGLDERSTAIREANKERAENRDVMSRPDFGWTMAMSMASTGWTSGRLEKPSFRWVRLAVKFVSGVAGEHGDADGLSAVAGAFEIYMKPTPDRLFLHAALLARDATAASVADALSLDTMVVEAYDSLFYSVLDRKNPTDYLMCAVKHGVTYERGNLPPDNPEEVAFLLAGLYGTVEDVALLVPRDDEEAAA
jgi:hypothetical protein